MRRYVFLNNRYYNLLFEVNHLQRFIQAQAELCRIIPVDTILKLHRLLFELENVAAELQFKEDTFCEIFPIDFIYKMIDHGVSINI